MPSKAQVVSLYDDQVQVKFTPGRHQYHVAIPNGKVIVGDQEAEFPTSRRSFTKLLSATTIGKNAFWKPLLANWIKDTCMNSFRDSLLERQARGLLIDHKLIHMCHDDNLNASNRRMQTAGDLGTAVHDWLEEYVLYTMGKAPEPRMPQSPVELKNGVEALKRWIENHDLKFKAAEVIVYNPFLDICGTIDLVDINDSVWDAKTGNGVYEDAYMQRAFYTETWKLQTGNYNDGGGIIHIDKKTGQFNVITKTEAPARQRKINHDLDFTAFEAAHYLHTWQNELGLYGNEE